MESENTMMRYLLGELPEQEAVLLEERFFRDDDCFEELRAVEVDLIDQYVRGELSETTRQSFETHFLNSPSRRERVNFAQVLADAGKLQDIRPPVATSKVVTLKKQGTSRVRPLQPYARWLAVAAMLLAIAGVWAAIQNRRLAREVNSLEASRSVEQKHREELESKVLELQALNAQLSGQLEQGKNSSPPKGSDVASLIAFVLSPGMVRGTDEPSRIVVPREVSQVKLQLDLETIGDYRSYRAELRTAGGQLLWSQDELQAKSTNWGKAVVLTLPAVVLAPAEHELTLRGLVSRGKFEDSGYYYFSVTKR